MVLKNLEESYIRVAVERVKLDAPIQFRLLCSLSAKWTDDFKPCSGDLYQPITSIEH